MTRIKVGLKVTSRPVGRVTVEYFTVFNSYVAAMSLEKLFDMCDAITNFRNIM